MRTPAIITKDVFISYSRKDAELVRRVEQELTAASLRIWRDERDVPAGVPWWQWIEEGLHSSQTVVAIVTSSSLESEWVNEELAMRRIQYMEDKTRRLIPVLTPGIDRNKVPLRLQQLNPVDLRQLDLENPAQFKSGMGKLEQAIRGELSESSVDIAALPIVILAMTHDHFEELPAVLKQPPARVGDDAAFDRLQQALMANGIANLGGTYGRYPEDWQPIACDGTPIRDVVKNVIERFNEQQKRISGTLVQPQFFSTDFTSADAAWRGKVWKQLLESGCVLIVDAISLFHPLLAWHFLQSGIGASERSSVAIVPPFGSRAVPINAMIQEEVRTRNERTFTRYGEDLDSLCEFGAADLLALRRWFFRILPDVSSSLRDTRPTTTMRERARAQANMQPRRIHQLLGRRRK